MAKNIMIQGTASGVGKTMIVTALCYIFAKAGYKVAPFKAQNMTGATAFTKNGEEIAISQYLQALAAGAAPKADMNPIILKPSKNATEIILKGKYFDTINSKKFREIKEALAKHSLAAYHNLAKEYDIIVIEGAGSPVELNINKDDIVNMGLAKKIMAPVILVGDIDRGGLFASIYGTLELMPTEEKELVKATIVNRFRGEISYFKDGIKILEDITKLPVAGVIPYFHMELPEEDSLFSNQVDFKEGKDFSQQFELIGNKVKNSINMDMVYKIMNYERS